MKMSELTLDYTYEMKYNPANSYSNSFTPRNNRKYCCMKVYIKYISHPYIYNLPIQIKQFFFRYCVINRRRGCDVQLTIMYTNWATFITFRSGSRPVWNTPHRTSLYSGIHEIDISRVIVLSIVLTRSRIDRLTDKL